MCIRDSLYDIDDFQQTHPTNITEIVAGGLGSLFRLIDNEIYEYSLNEQESFFAAEGSEYSDRKISKSLRCHRYSKRVFVKAVYADGNYIGQVHHKKAGRGGKINARGHQHFWWQSAHIAHRKFLAINPAYAKHDKALRAEKRKELKEQKLSLVESA
jgi:hypothetical protein